MSNSPNKRMLKAPHLILFIILTFLAILTFFNIDNFLELYRAIFLDALRYRNPAMLSDYEELYHYTFEPKTILAEVRQGKKELFKSAPDYSDNVYSPSSFPWKQQDYLKVSNALYQFAHKDSLTYWKLYHWSFGRNCSDNPIGFDDAKIVYFNPRTGEHTAMFITPLAKAVEWGKNDHFESPSFWGWKSINPTQIKIAADDALQIAETNGGESVRLAVQNQCYISISLYANKNLWEVDYYGNSGGNNFKMTVDPYYGDYKIIIQKN